MGIRNEKLEVKRRMEAKNLDTRFLNILREGLNCSAFEAEAVLGAVHEVYFPFLDEACVMSPPGKVTLVAVCADEPAGKSVADCEKRTVSLSVHRGAADDQLLLESGAEKFRQAKIPDLCQEALSQGAVLTREDLAHRVFFVSTRTISRDLTAFRSKDANVPLPMRGTVRDIGPVLTHRVSIVRLALEGKTTSDICNITHHSPQAVANYLSTFARCAQLERRGIEAGQIAFLLRRGKGLVRQYLDLLKESEADKNAAYHLKEMLLAGGGEQGKKRKGGGENGTRA